MKGNTSIDMPWAAWALPATRPMQMNSHVKAKPKTTQSPNAASAAGDAAVEAEPDREAERRR